MTTRPAYTKTLISILETFADSQNEVLDLVAKKCADTLGNKGLIHLFGSGHSVIPTLDAFPRYGSFVGLYPLNDPRLMWHNVLGPGGVRELLWLERTEGYIDKFLEQSPSPRATCWSSTRTAARTPPASARRFTRRPMG